MEIFSQYKHYVAPAVISAVTFALLKMGIFVTHGDLEQSLRLLETAIRAEYATQRDIQDIKTMLNHVDAQLTRLEERLSEQAPRRTRP